MRQILTDPPDCVFPTQDNVDGNLVVAKGDYILKSKETRYMAIELLGTGTFGQVFRCVSNEGEEVAIKVIKASNKYYQYSMNEVRTLKRLKDAKLTPYFVELLDAFIYHQHLCIVLERLGINMYEWNRILRFNGLEYAILRNVLHQLLEGLCELQKQGITHSDLKPENILISDIYRYRIKIIDFGSSTTRAMSTIFYAQSRFYRAPEVILGIPYSSLIDVWSFGCIAYELLMGHPLFPGSDNGNQILLIHEFFEDGLPSFMVEHGQHSNQFPLKAKKTRFRGNTQYITQGMMEMKIREKYKMAPENDAFIDMLMMALKPSYLERAMPQTLLEHRFFSQVSDRRSVGPVSLRRVSPPVPSLPETQRKISMFNYGREDEDERKDVRKGSVYDPEYENRFNRK